MPRAGAILSLNSSSIPDHEIYKPVAVLPGVVGDALGEFRKLLALGLAYIEDISGAKANQDGLVLSADVLFRVFFLLPACSDDGSQNADAVLPLLDLAAKLVPRVEASNAGCVRLLRSTHTLPTFC